MIHCLSAREQPTEFKMSVKYDASHFINGELAYSLLPYPGRVPEAGYFLPPHKLPSTLGVSGPPWLPQRAPRDIGWENFSHSCPSDLNTDRESARSRGPNLTKQCHTYNMGETEKDSVEYKQKHSSSSSHSPVKHSGGLLYNRQAQGNSVYYDTDFYPGSISSSGRRSPYVQYRQYESMNGRDVRPSLTRALSLQTVDSVESRFIANRERRPGSYSPDKEDGMMDKDKEEGAINLSTASSNPSDSPIVNGNSSLTTNGENGHNTQGQGTLSQSQANNKNIPTVSGTGTGPKRKATSKPPSVGSVGELSPDGTGVQSVLMLAAQHGLSPQQMQQLLQQQQGALPQQLQQMMQQQQSYMMQHQQHQKVHEQMLHQLNEQLQLNMLQQSQLMQQEKGKGSGGGGKQAQQQLQQLMVQQQQLVQQIQQIQIQQRQYLFACLMQPFGTPQGMMSPAEIQQLWKEVAAQSGSDDQMKANINGLAMASSGSGLTPDSLLRSGNGLSPDGFLLPGSLIGQPQVAAKQEDGFSNPLYRHGVCKWPGCDTACDDFSAFTKHLNAEHTLDDRNTAQARVQMQVVTQLEIQLTREKELLHAMMQHLHMKPQRDREEREREMKIEPMTSPKLTTPVGSPVKTLTNPLPVSSPPIHMPPIPIAPLPPVTSVTSGLPPLVIPPPQAMMTSSKPTTPQSQSSSQPPTPTGLGPMRRRVSDKCNLPISAEIQRNREFYKNTDVRPPFTYASLIRQAIIESQNKQLTLNEVYQWFQNTFAYFRRNEATWKNAVRHNLSLHKCFMRVENVKGAVWTVDEVEFYKRRPQKLTGAIAGSPSLASDPSMYGDNINASLRAALEQSSMLLSQQQHHHQHQQLCNGSLSSDGAEDLSMKSQNNSNDSFSKSSSPSREEAMFLVKPESATVSQEEIANSSPQSSSHLSDQQDDQYAEAAAKHYLENMSKHYGVSPPDQQYMDGGDYTDSAHYPEALGRVFPDHHSNQFTPQGSDTEPILGGHDEPINQSDAQDMEKTRMESVNTGQSEALNMTREAELARSTSNEGSPSSSHGSPVNSLSNNQELYSPLLHTPNLAVASHSIPS